MPVALIDIAAGIVGKRFAKAAVVTVGVLLLLGAAWLSLHLYGAHRYKEGVAATDAKWQAAVAKLREDAAKSATKADDAAAKRTADQLIKHTKDQEAVNEAQRSGTSPLDALFGN